ncbi:EboA domain-containing protein [Streptomyces sp. NPDC012421]|uniref:EboA domain-containing protein n=1 Tax=Streptomyces sp. NPDC012421 TaxID=3364832 RepID=UPI0036E50861
MTTAAPLDTLAALRSRLTPTALDWLDRALADAAAPHEPAGNAKESSRWERHFTEAGRHCPGDEDAVRCLLLATALPDAAGLTRLYAHGTAAERRAVLRALPLLPRLAPDAVLPLVEDALRSNDTRLIASAVGPWAARHLPAHAWRHAVLKCLFTGVPLAAVADFERRAADDRELARMLVGYAAERLAAGRDIPDDLDRALRLTPQES